MIIIIGLIQVEDIPFPAMVLNKDELVISFNRMFKDMLGKELNYGLPVKGTFQNWVSIGDSEVFTASCENKNYVFIKSRSENTDISIFIVIETSEIYELQQKIKELEKVNRELDAIIENSYDGIYITDTKGVTLKTNSAIKRITGIPKEYYIGKKVDKLIKRGILENSVTHKVVKQKRTVSLIQHNFAGKETLMTGNPVFNEEGEIEKVVTNIRDLSDLYELHTELRKATELNDKYKKELERLKRSTTENGFVVYSEQLKIIYDMAERIANVDATVLILGETGVGKDVLAKHIYNKSIRSNDGDFIKVNCGAIPPDLLESELFGYESGAFTGANRKGKPGMFELADKGILFLDEIGELSMPLQVKLLRAIQEREIQRIGGTKTKKVDVRVIAATNRNLKEMVLKGDFREDLYYRLNVIPIEIPPLRDRRDDILPLIEVFFSRTCQKYDIKKELDPELKDFFYRYDWPGNVRELSNLVERLVVTTSEETIKIDHLPPEYNDSSDKSISFSEIVPLKQAVEIAEEKILSLAVQKYQNTYEMAEALNTSQPTVVRKLKKYNLKV